MSDNQEISKKTEAFLRQNYTPVPKTDSEEILIAMINFLERYVSGAIPQRMILDELLRTIHRTFGFQYLCIALKEKDGMYRYKTSVGLTSEATRALREIAYSDSDLFDESEYPSTVISENTRFYMAEGMPYKPGEEATYPRPAILMQKRNAPEDMLEGDFFNVFVRGARNEVLGYLEIGVTRNYKLPEKRSLIWLETIARILAIIITSEGV
ncbi:MAG: hypothetical protein QXE45_02455 [Thermoplasmata archaeon]